MAAALTHEAFDQMLLASLSPESPIREASETQLTDLLHSQPDTLAVMFVYAMRRSPHLEARQTAAVLFRRYSFHATDEKASFWPRLAPATQESVKKELLDSLSDDTPPEVRHKVSDAVAHIARNLSYALAVASPGNPAERPHFWPELLQHLWACIQSPAPNHRDSALRIFSVVPSVFGAQLDRYINEIAMVLDNNLKDSAHIEVQMAAARAFTTFILSVSTEQRAAFTGLVPVVVQVIGSCLEQNKTEGAQTCLQSLIELAENEAKFFRPMLRDLVTHMARLAGNESLDDGCRNLAVELLVMLCEAGAGMMRKMPDFVSVVVPMCMRMMMELEDEDDWAMRDSVDDLYDLDSTSSIGEQAIDRIACALGGEAVMGTAFQVIAAMVQRPEWQARHAALMAISAIGEGCYKKMRDHLKVIVDAIIPLMHDAHPRVRFASCNALGQLATDFAPRENRQTAVCFQTLFHQQVIPALCQLTLDTAHPRVQAHAAAALVNFCDGASRTVMAPYLDTILTHLGNLLSSQFIIVQEQAVTTIATVADAAREHFKNYYPSFIPHLKHILANARDGKHRMLRAKTLECVSLMGLAVGKEMFVADVAEVTVALQEMQTAADADDPQNSYMLSSWARICQILGKDFAPYLGLVMTPLLRSVVIQPDVVPLEEDEEIDDDTQDWQYISIEDQRMGIKTSAMDEKRTGCEMLCIYARMLEGNFAPYVAEILPVSIKLFKFYFEDGVRMYSAALMPFLIGALKDNPSFGPAAANSAWLSVIANPLMECIKSEFDSDALIMELDALRDCLERVGAEGLPPELLAVLTEVMREQLEEQKARCLARLKARTEDEDYDHEGEGQLKEDEENDSMVMQNLSDIVHALFDILHDRFLPYFDTLLPFYVEMLAPTRSAPDHQWGLCVFDDLVEACGALSSSYARFFVEAMLNYITDHDAAVRQAACYGVGMMALHGGPEYVPYLQQAIPRLLSVINDPRARSMGNIDATENAISAFVKVSCNAACGIPVTQCVPTLAGWLPFTEDVEEAGYVYTYICDRIEENQPAIMDKAILVRVLEAFATSADGGVLEDDVEARVVRTLRHLRAALPEAALGEIFGALSAGAQRKLTEMLATATAPVAF